MLALAHEERSANAAPLATWRLHDLRRTFVSGCGELGIRGEAIELCINHQSGARGGVAGIYNRSTLLSERKEAFERWAAHVQGLVSGEPDKVVQLPRKQGGK